MGFYLEEYRDRVGTWNTRSSWRSAVGHVATRRGNIYMGSMILCAVVLASLLMIRGVESNPGSVDNIVQVSCSSYDKELEEGNSMRIMRPVVS